jgi:hypothetical protein
MSYFQLLLFPGDEKDVVSVAARETICNFALVFFAVQFCQQLVGILVVVSKPKVFPFSFKKRRDDERKICSPKNVLHFMVLFFILLYS